MKSLQHLLQLLVGAAGRDGNMILNVGPRPDGQIDPPQADRLSEIGQWLTQNGESIYSTRGGPYLPGPWGVSTHNGKAVYIHILHPPAIGVLTLPTLPTRVVSASLLNGPALQFQQDTTTLTLNLPPIAPETTDTILKLELSEPWTTSAVIPVPEK